MQNISFDNISPSDMKDFLKKLSVVSNRHANEDKISGTAEERKLHTRIYELEKELQKTKKERDEAVEENRIKINELNDALVSMKTLIHKLLEDKKQRIRHLEGKIRKEVKI